MEVGKKGSSQRLTQKAQTPQALLWDYSTSSQEHLASDLHLQHMHFFCNCMVDIKPEHLNSLIKLRTLSKGHLGLRPPKSIKTKPNPFF